MNKIEEHKKEKDGLDILDDIPRYATDGWESISDGDKERLKWAGVFFRRQTPGHFMMRLRISNGFLSAIQLRTIGETAGSASSDATNN
jgi:ferredoxin-nitrite reductase